MTNKIKTILIFFQIYYLFPQTSNQIKQVKDYAKQSGMSKQQLIEVAKEKGYSNDQINRALEMGKKDSENQYSEENNKVDDNGISSEANTSNVKSINDDEYAETVNDDKKNEINNKATSLISDNSTRSEYFGYDIFNKDPALFQGTLAGAVDPNYLIGPGDELIAMLWGETQFRQVLKVDREGFIFIPEIGQVFVNGLNLNLLESKLFRVFSQSYASLNPQGRTPTTFLDVSLGNLRPLRIQVLGEVAQPGAYTVSPSTTLFSALYYFKGPTFLGSLRDVQLIRNSKKIASIDFYNYLLKGEKINDYQLQLDDVVFIPPRLKTVKIEGKIKRAGVYELKNGEDLKELILIAGGLTSTAYLDRIQINRIIPFEDREKLGMDRTLKDVSLRRIMYSDEEFLLKDGDIIQIFSIMDNIQNTVEISGAVNRPGHYEFVDSLRLSQLLRKADDVTPDAYLKRVDITRLQPDLSEKLIILNLEQAIVGDEGNDIILKISDRVKIYSKLNMIDKKYVSILGNIKIPGTFPLKENMRVYDLIFSAGGFLDEEFKKKTYLARADLIRFTDDFVTKKIIKFNLGSVLNDSKSIHNHLLKPGDQVKIYNNDIFISNKPVTINGAIFNSGVYDLKESMSLKDIIIEAGGLDKNAYHFKVEIARINPMNKNLNEFAKIINLGLDKELNRINLSTNLKNPQLDIAIPADEVILEPYDLITIRNDPFFKTQKKVLIEGEVLYPGSYVIQSSNELLTDLIDRAGGTLKDAYLNASRFKRNGIQIKIPFEKIIKDPSLNANITLMDKDSIFISPKLNVINIRGEINNSGIHKFVADKRLRYYLKISGGLKPDADKSNIWVDYPNGDSEKYKPFSLLSPKIIDGSVINIGKKKEEEPFNKTDFAKELTSIVANLAQAIAIFTLAKQ